jgi:hypothetical protein
MIIEKRIRPGIFIEVGTGYVLSRISIRENTSLTIGDEISNEFALLRVFWLCEDNEPIGYYFEAPHPCLVRNSGNYLLSYIESRRGRASTSETIVKVKVKDEKDKGELVVFNFGGCGALACAQPCDSETQTIFEEQ